MASLLDGLFHRLLFDNITFMSYAEAKRTLNYSFMDYLEAGGLYNAYQYEDFQCIRDYIDSSVVSNIYNTIKKNKSINSVLNKASESEISSIVYLILYSVVYSNTMRLDFWKVINATTAKDNTEEISTLEQLLESELNVNIGYVKKSLLTEVLRIMKRIMLLIEVCNIGKQGGVTYYINNPLLSNQLYKRIVSVIQSYNYEFIKNNFSQIKNFILESVVVCHAYYKSGCSVYYYRNDKTGKEIDLILEYSDIGMEQSNISLYEICLSNDLKKVKDRAKCIFDKSIKQYCVLKCCIKNRKIICGAVTSDIENVINYEEFCLNTRKEGSNLIE